MIMFMIIKNYYLGKVYYCYLLKVITTMCKHLNTQSYVVNEKMFNN